MIHKSVNCRCIVVVGLIVLSSIGTSRADEIAEIIDLQARFTALQEDGRYKEALPLAEQYLARVEKAFQDKPKILAIAMNDVAVLYRYLGRFADSESLNKRALELREKVLGKDHVDVAMSLTNLGLVYWDLGRYADAEPIYLRALAIYERNLGPNDSQVAIGLHNLAGLYLYQGRLAEAEPLFKRALVISETTLGPDHSDVTLTLRSLGILYDEAGRFAEAEPLLQRAVTICKKTMREDHPDLAGAYFNLGNLYTHQGRYAEAELLHTRTLAMREKSLGKEHSLVAETAHNLGLVLVAQRRYDEAEALFRRALAINEKAVGPEHPDVALNLSHVAMILKVQTRYAEAEALCLRALAIQEKVLGKDHHDTGNTLYHLADIYRKQGKYHDAETAAERSLQIRIGPSGDTRVRYDAYELRARLRWEIHREDEAIADLARALDLAEEARGNSSGDETQRAESFASFADGYERMVGWQQHVGRPDGALAAIERGRARSLVDQLASSGIDLLEGLPAAEAAALRLRDMQAKTRLAQLEKQAEGSDRNDLQAELLAARQEVIDAYVAIRNASPAYRQLVGRNYKPATLTEIQTRLVGADCLLLEYFLGKEAGYLIVIPPTGEKARVELLNLDKEQAATLGVDAGPLTIERMRAILANDAGSGLLQQLRRPASAAATTDRLAVLWNVLIPEAERKLLTGGKLKRWIVVPDAALSAFPFETLVVQPGEKPQYLLDVAPPLVSSPSATLLLNLSEVSATKPTKGVLSVGDAIYGAAATAPQRSRSALVGLSPRSRYGSLKGDLNPLPFTGLESQWVAEVFKKAGISTGRLEKQNAREASVRMYGPGNEILHLACHGLVDDEAGASLISVFCSAVAKGKQGEQLDYAASLQAAKRWVRNQDKWRSPYYWGTFVLVGPN